MKYQKGGSAQCQLGYTIQSEKIRPTTRTRALSSRKDKSNIKNQAMVAVGSDRDIGKIKLNDSQYYHENATTFRLSMSRTMNQRQKANIQQFRKKTNRINININKAKQTELLRHTNQVKTAKNLEDDFEAISARRNRYTVLEAFHNKGGALKDKEIQNWLNHILVDSCQGEKFDSMENSALKKFGIDKNSLLSKGVHPSNVTRIFRSMFVYSLGFNNLLKELSDRSVSLRKTIWKVYAILLEYCADGSFQTMIGEIERDKKKKLQQFKQEIEKRQRIIDYNDELNEERNAKILNELKILKMQNGQLENQNTSLIEDYKETEQAFNQEVRLRLKFEHKINQIHGVYRELILKHERLLEDHNKQKETLNLLTEELEKSRKRCHDLLSSKKACQNEISQLKSKQQFNLKVIEELGQTATQLQKNKISTQNSNADMKMIIQENKRHSEQLETELKNAEIIIEAKTELWHKSQGLYQTQLEENQKLYGVIKQQSAKLNEFFEEKKRFNQLHLKTIAENQVKGRKIYQYECKIKQIDSKIRDSLCREAKLQNNFDILLKEKDTLEDALSNCHKNIAQMKRVNIDMEEQVNYLEKKANAHSAMTNERDKEAVNLRQQRKKLELEKQLLTIANQELESNYILLEQKNKSAQETQLQKYNKLKAQKDQLLAKFSNSSVLIRNAENQAEICKNEHEQLTRNLKNQRFERQNLDLRYKQSLSVVESETAFIRELNISISELKEVNQDQKRKIRKLQAIIREKEDRFAQQNALLRSSFRQAKAQFLKKQDFIHPLHYQNVVGCLQRMQQKFQFVSKKIVNFQAEIIMTKEQADQKIVKIRNDYELLLGETTKKYQRQLELKDQQIILQKECKNKNADKIEKLQFALQKTNKETVQTISFNNSRNQEEKKYITAIKQKTNQIEILLKELQKAHDSNSVLHKQIRSLQERIEKYQQDSKVMAITIKSLQEEKKRKQQFRIEGISQKEKIVIQPELQEKAAQVQSKLLDANVGQLSVPSDQCQRSRSISQQRSQNGARSVAGRRGSIKTKLQNAYSYYNK